MPDDSPDRPITARTTIGIVTYNSARVIGETLASLIDAVEPAGDAAIVVRDNASTDDTVAIVRSVAEGRPFVHLLAGDDNPGYGGGNNRIIERVDSTWHVVCNPDILVAPDTLATCIAFMERHADVAVVSPRMTFRDGTHQRANRRHPTVLDLVLRRFVPRRLRPLFARRMDAYEMADVGYAAVCEVPFCSGSFMVCRTAALKAVGGFDERYFLYFEDADLSRTLQQAGWRTVYVPDAAVVHGWQRESHKSLRMALVMARNGVRYFGKWGWKIG